MNTVPTTTTRRTFIARALGTLATVPLLAHTVPSTSALAKIPLPATQADLDALAKQVKEPAGVAIKVPSNRRAITVVNGPKGAYEGYTYLGDWDGTFKLERGCTNPAYILADLYERTGTEPDWVVASKRELIRTFGSADKVHLHWQMLYDYGRYCDETISGCRVIDQQGLATMTGCEKISWFAPIVAPRFAVNPTRRTPEQMVALRKTLRLHCLSWQSTDPRYRTSWPGVRSYIDGGEIS